MKNFLKRYRTRLKLDATQQLEATITKLFNIIADDSALKNTIIMVQARYQNLEQEDIKGIIAAPDRALRTNQITNSLFQLIDNIESTDLQESDDVLLNGYLNKQKAATNEFAEAETPKATADDQQIKEESPTDSPIVVPKEEPKAVEDIAVVTSFTEIGTGAKTESNALSPKSAKDLEIFTEMHRKTLTFFPSIYRDLRSLVFKNGKASLGIAQLMEQVEKVRPDLHAYQSRMDQLEPILKKVRVDFDKKIYWMQFQQLMNRRTALKMENLSEIVGMNTELNAFIEMLKERKIVS